jgi:hypothetical protein
MHRGGFCLPAPRPARQLRSKACSSGPTSPAGESRHYQFNTPLAQRELRARGRNWFEGRIAKCPRLQQKPSDLPSTELAVIVSYSSPLRGVKPMASPIVRSRISACPLRRSSEHARK